MFTSSFTASFHLLLPSIVVEIAPSRNKMRGWAQTVTQYFEWSIASPPPRLITTKCFVDAGEWLTWETKKRPLLFIRLGAHTLHCLLRFDGHTHNTNDLSRFFHDKAVVVEENSIVQNLAIGSKLPLFPPSLPPHWVIIMRLEDDNVSLAWNASNHSLWDHENAIHRSCLENGSEDMRSSESHDTCHFTLSSATKTIVAFIFW